jgi:hypothetical protein
MLEIDMDNPAFPLPLVVPLGLPWVFHINVNLLESAVQHDTAIDTGDINPWNITCNMRQLSV